VKMKLIIAAASTAVLVGTAYAQNSPGPRVPEPDAKVTNQPTTGQQQTTDPRTTTGQAPIPAPGQGSPYGAKGGAVPGVPNPDRVAPAAPGGQRSPP
jgi:hypothetical protein